MKYTSLHAIGDEVTVYLEDVCFDAEIVAIRFDEKKVYYDMEINASDGYPSLIRDIDAALLEE